MAAGPLHLDVPAADRRTDRALCRGRGRAERAAHRQGRHLCRGAALRRRAGQEDADRRSDGADRRPHLRHPRRRTRAGDCLAWHTGLHAADLFRLLGLFRHGDRAGAAVRLPVSREFRPSLCRALGDRVLAALAHDPVALVPRLSLHSARRQPRRAAAYLCQSRHRVPGHRHLARSGLDLCVLGALARRLPSAGARFPAGLAGPRPRPDHTPPGSSPLSPLSAHDRSPP